MTRTEIATLICKSIAVWMFATVVAEAAFFMVAIAVSIGSIFTSTGFDASELKSGWILGVPSVAQLIVGLFLWFRAPRLAARMVSDDPAPVTRPDMNVQDVLAVAFMTVGVYLLIPLVRSLTRNIYEMALGEYSFKRWLLSGSTLSLFVGFALSIWLILGSRGIVRVVLWAREAAAKRGGETGASDAGEIPKGQ